METTIEQKKQGLFAAAVNYGLLTAIGLIILSLVGYLLGLEGQVWLGFIGYAILLAGIIIGTINFRKESGDGYISYGRALGFGTLTAVIAGFISGLFILLFYQFIAPDALEALRTDAEMRVLEMHPNATDQQIEIARMMVNPWLMFIGSIFSYAFIGFIFSLVTSAFLKKNEPLDVEL